MPSACDLERGRERRKRPLPRSRIAELPLISSSPGPAGFCLSDGARDIAPDSAHGVLFLDTRFVSRLQLLVDGHRLEPLGVSVEEPFSAVFFCRTHPRAGYADSGLVVFRRRWVGRGLREEIEIHNHEVRPRSVEVDLLVDADFAGLSAVKEGVVRHRGAYSSEIDESTIRFGHRLGASSAVSMGGGGAALPLR